MQVYSLNEITDSRVLYDKRPPRFMLYIILIVTVLIVGFLVWANKSIKTYVVKSQGMVTTENKTNIMTNITGQISSVNISEGKTVKEGDVLFTISPTESNLQLEQINSQIDYENRRIELLTRAEQDAGKGENNFSKKKIEELEFYNRLQNNYSKKGEYAVDEQALKGQGYTDDQIKQYIKTQDTKLNELYYDTILGFTTEKSQLQTDLNKLQAQKSALEKSLGAYNITAQKSGIVHLPTAITKGMVLQQGNLVGSISNSDGGLVIETALPSSERPMVNVADEVSLAVAGLNQAEYGTVRGKIISIDKDANIDNQKGNVYFNVKVKPEQNFLKDKKGQKVNLTLGMVTETRVKYEKITYIKYFLEQIGIKFD